MKDMNKLENEITNILPNSEGNFSSILIWLFNIIGKRRLRGYRKRKLKQQLPKLRKENREDIEGKLLSTKKVHQLKNLLIKNHHQKLLLLPRKKYLKFLLLVKKVQRIYQKHWQYNLMLLYKILKQ